MCLANPPVFLCNQDVCTRTMGCKSGFSFRVITNTYRQTDKQVNPPKKCNLFDGANKIISVKELVYLAMCICLQNIFWWFKGLFIIPLISNIGGVRSWRKYALSKCSCLQIFFTCHKYCRHILEIQLQSFSSCFSLTNSQLVLSVGFLQIFYDRLKRLPLDKPGRQWQP